MRNKLEERGKQDERRRNGKKTGKLEEKNIENQKRLDDTQRNRKKQKETGRNRKNEEETGRNRKNRKKQ